MKKISFNDKHLLTFMVKAGKKTQFTLLVPDRLINKIGVNRFTFDAKTADLTEAAPYKKGETLAVAETYRDILTHLHGLEEFEYYGLSNLEGRFQEEKGWDNKRFVKAEYMPTRILITDVTCKRLEDITEQEALSEGVTERKDVIDSRMNPVRCYTCHRARNYKTPIIVKETND